MTKDKVIIYTGEHCGACQMAKDYLKDKGIDYQEIDLTKEENDAYLKKITSLDGHLALPIIEIGKKMIIGFNKRELDDALK